MWLFSRLTSDDFAAAKPDADFLNPRHFYSHLFLNLCSGWSAWWARHTYQVMLTFHGRLITPIHFGSMSVCLNILNLCVYPFDFLKYDFGMLNSGSLSTSVVIVLDSTSTTHACICTVSNMCKRKTNFNLLTISKSRWRLIKNVFLICHRR